MKTLSMWAGMLALTAAAAMGQEYVSKTASGTTSAAVNFSAQSGALRLVSLDATSDKADSVVTWRVGSAPTTVAAAAASNTTNITTYATSLAANDVVLIQKADGTVLQKTVFGVVAGTNKQVLLANAIGTNLAVGSTFKRKIGSGFTVLHPVATNATNVIVSGLTGLATNEYVVLRNGRTVYHVQAVGFSTTTAYRQTLVSGVGEMAVGDAVYNLSGTTTYITNTTLAVDATALHVRRTNGFAANDLILVESKAGPKAVLTVSAASTTNLTVAAGAGFVLTTNDVITLLTNATTILQPNGDQAVTLYTGVTNRSGVVLVGKPSNGPVWKMATKANAATATVYNLQLGAALNQVVLPGATFYEATNTYTLTTAATAAGYQVTVDTVAGLSAGSDVVILPSTGGAFWNTFRTSENILVNTVQLSATTGTALAAGDTLYGTTTQTTPLGNTTLRLSGPALFTAPAGRPAALSINGTSACAINGALGVYQ